MSNISVAWVGVKSEVDVLWLTSANTGTNSWVICFTAPSCGASLKTWRWMFDVERFWVVKPTTKLLELVYLLTIGKKSNGSEKKSNLFIVGSVNTWAKHKKILQSTYMTHVQLLIYTNFSLKHILKFMWIWTFCSSNQPNLQEHKSEMCL